MMTRFLSLVLACLLIGCASVSSPNMVRLNADGSISLNGQATTTEELPAKLDSGEPMVIQMAPRAHREDLVELMRIAQQAGIRNVSVAPEAVIPK
jgi:biopolymer transport protein ExbD